MSTAARGLPAKRSWGRSRILPWIAPGLVVGLVVGCATTRLPAPPDTFAQLPWGQAAHDRTVLRARQAFERGEAQVATEMLAPVLAAEPQHVDALRLRQDLLRNRGRTGKLRAEAEALLAQQPDSPLAHYLMGRLVAGNDNKLRWFGRAAELAPDALWPFLGLAHTLRSERPRDALELYRQLYAATGQHPLVALAYADTLRRNNQPADALPIYAALLGNRDLPGVGELGLAQTYLLMEQRREAWAALLGALRQRPYDPGVQGLLRDWQRAGMPEEQLEQVLDVLREQPQRFQQVAQGDGGAMLATLLQRLQQPHAALAVLEAAGVSARQPALRRLQRRLLLSTGDVRACLDLLIADLPHDLVADEGNQVRGLWLTLLNGPWRSGDPLATAAQSEELVAALLAAGLLPEVELVAEQALRRWPEAREGLSARRDEARAELAFEAAVRRLLYQGYAGKAQGGLEPLLQQIRELSRLVLGRDVVGKSAQFQAPMVGRMLDPFRADLCRHFARYNRHFVLGQRSGGVPEGLVLTRLSVRELEENDDLPLPTRCLEVIGVDRDVRSLSGVLGGDLAGIALLNHFVIDYDAVRDWAHGIADRRRIAHEDGLAVLSDPLPQAPGGEPLDVAWRLGVVCKVDDRGLDAAVLAMIRAHERQHLVDSFHYLPFESNLLRGLGLLIGFGLSPSAIEAEMERRAELSALIVAPYPELVLAHIADFAERPEEQDAASPHYQGFSRLARELTTALQGLGVPAAAAVPSQWHRLDMELVRRAARRLREALY